jgi:hypothetical protein
MAQEVDVALGAGAEGAYHVVAAWDSDLSQWR